jgi:uracil-DNA glycosylase family 4
MQAQAGKPMHATEPLSLLRFYADCGVDDVLAETPFDRFAEPPPRAAPPPPRIAPAEPPRRAMAPAIAAAPAAAEAGARSAAAAAATLDELRDALNRFDGCALRQTATNLVFADGNPQAPLMLIGEGPGREEDARGLPFVGDSGRLLDRMLAAIGLDRTGCYITNVIPWRPPGNRNPSQEEIVSCLPFIRRHIELVQPKLVALVGAISAKSLLDRSEGITRLRGRWFDLKAGTFTVPALPVFHPAYLLRTPEAKRDAWRDMLDLRRRLDSLNG